MGMTNEEREKHIRIANMLIGAIHDLIRPILMYQIEKDVTREALENYIKMLEQQPCEDVVSIGVFEQVKWERDVAIEQLEQLGYSLGEKIRTSEDCISREQTLKAFAEKCGGECACCEYNGSGYDNAENCKLIKSMPSATPQRSRGKWIPVSEKLPNSYEYILATMISPVTQLPFVNKLYTGENAKEKIEEAKVIAWMPIMKPYKEK